MHASFYYNLLLRCDGTLAHSTSSSTDRAPPSQSTQHPLVEGARVDTKLLDGCGDAFPLALVYKLTSTSVDLLFQPGPGHATPTLQKLTLREFASSQVVVLPPEGGYVRVKFQDDTWLVETHERSVYAVPEDIVGSDLQQWLVDCARSNEGHCTITGLDR